MGVHVGSGLSANVGSGAKPVLKPRLDGVWRWLQRNRSEEDLFSAACLVAEMLGVRDGSGAVAQKLLEGAAQDNGLWALVGRERVRRTIANGLAHVSRKPRSNMYPNGAR
jgi:hypothetical protein